MLPIGRNTALAAGATLACVILASGCVTVATKEVVSNSTEYLSQNFTPVQLLPQIRATIEKGRRVPDGFKTIRVNYRIETEEDGRKHEATSVVDLTNLGNGYVQMRAELAKNSVPYRINLALSFGGIYKIKTQTVFLGRSNALLPMDTKELKRFDRDLANPQRGVSYTIDSTTGTSQQFANFTPEVMSCMAGDTRPASSVHGTLTGEAVVLDCSLIGVNSVVVTRARYMWLRDYAVALQHEMADSRSKSAYTVSAVEVTR